MTEIVSTTPKKMVRIKFKYVDVGQDPMVVFEDDESAVTGCRDQFYTACGPYDSATTDLDCTDTLDPQNVNVQFLDANFDSSGATLSDKDFELLSGLSVYPNPTQGMLYLNGDISNIRRIQLYDIAGQKVMDLQEELAMIDIRFLKASIYFLDIKTSAGSQVIRIVKY
jgi:hypothetical protein